MASIETVVSEHYQHAMQFRERFPEQAKTLEALQSAASQFKAMMLGTDDSAAWNPEDHRIAELLIEVDPISRTSFRGSIFAPQPTVRE